MYGKTAGIKLNTGTRRSAVKSGTSLPVKFGSSNYVTDTLSNLEFGVTYFVNLYIERMDGSVDYGQELNFTTISTNRWVSSSTFFPGTFSYSVSGFFQDDEYYVVGGTQHTSPTGAKDVPNNEVYKYQMKSRKWVRLADFPGKVTSNAPLSVVNMKAYLINTYSKEVWEYDINADRWARKSDLPAAGSDGTSFAVGAKIHVVVSSLTDAAHFFLFDPASTVNGNDEFGNPKGNWTNKGHFPENVTGREVGFTMNNKGYVLNVYNKAKIYQYNAAQNSWTEVAVYPGTVPPPSIGGYDSFVFVLNNKIYVSAGRTAKDKTEVWIYDLAGGTWSELNAPDQAKHVGGANYQTTSSFVAEGFGHLWKDYYFVRYIP